MHFTACDAEAFAENQQVISACCKLCGSQLFRQIREQWIVLLRGLPCRKTMSSVHIRFALHFPSRLQLCSWLFMGRIDTSCFECLCPACAAMGRTGFYTWDQAEGEVEDVRELLRWTLLCSVVLMLTSVSRC